MSNMTLCADACSCAPGMFSEGGSSVANVTAMNITAMNITPTNITIGHTTPAAPRGA